MSTQRPIPNLSVAIVCKDNQRTIARTLGSVQTLASEIVAIDSGSSDQTLAMLMQAGAAVKRQDWLGHVRQKQLALDSCSNDWVLCLDSDESPDEQLVGSIRALLRAGEPERPGYTMNRMVEYRGRLLRHVWQPEPRLRLVNRTRCRWAGLDPHDYLEVIDGTKPGSLAGTLVHDSFESFAEHFRAQAGHAQTMARSLHAEGKRGSYLKLCTSPIGAFAKQLVLKRGFLDGRAGWLAASSTAVGTLMKHAALIEMRDNEV